MQTPPPQYAAYPRGGGGGPQRRGPGVYFEFIGDAFRRVFANPKAYFGGGGILFGALAVGIIIAYALLFASFAAAGPNQKEITASQIGGIVGFYVILIGLGFVMAVLSQGFCALAIEEADTGSTTISTFFKPMKRFWPLIGTVFITQLLIGLGSILCFVPGFYLSGILVFAPTICVHEGLGPIQSIQKSYEMTKNYAWMMALLVFVATMVGSLGAMACYVGFIFSLPVQYVTLALHYREFREVQPGPFDTQVNLG